mmetsp:Transcript_74790/g.216156  ORF Transcript_74790/g.216156 Transcript_74790/m.216156 type:complete len:136 (-) Transcript_74790:148-555(-)
MPEEYRIAAGLTVPSWLLRRSVQRQPEEMFRAHLRRIVRNTDATSISLHGHVRVYGELRALAVRRSIEGLHSRTPTETQVSETSQSEVMEPVAGDISEAEVASHVGRPASGAGSSEEAQVGLGGFAAEGVNVAVA